MRQTFLLDENIIYHAINGVDEDDQTDPTAADLLAAIAKICHGIFVHQSLIDRYNKALHKLSQYPPHSLAALNFVKQLLFRADKQNWAYGKLPALPETVGIPTEDRDIIRAALVSKPVFVTNDQDLRNVINHHHHVLGLRALDAQEALEFAKSERPD